VGRGSGDSRGPSRIVRCGGLFGKRTELLEEGNIIEASVISGLRTLRRAMCRSDDAAICGG